MLEFNERFPEYKNQEINIALSQGLQFIVGKQKQDGSWYGGWAVCFTYATWFAVEALVQAQAYIEPTLRKNCLDKACHFLTSKQMADGGWGETYESCANKLYTHAETSQVVNTAWSLLALQAAKSPDKNAIRRGIDLLLKRQLENGDWAQEGISGVFNYNCMITYSSYRNVFPIWALNRFYQYNRY